MQATGADDRLLKLQVAQLKLVFADPAYQESLRLGYNYVPAWDDLEQAESLVTEATHACTAWLALSEQRRVRSQVPMSSV